MPPIPNSSQLDRQRMGLIHAAFLGIPALRGFWSMGNMGETGSIPDLSSANRTLTYNGNPAMNLHKECMPYMDYDGTGDYHSRADEAGLRMVGTETMVASALRGVTLGCWAWADAAAPIAALISKWGSAAASQAYALRYTGSNTVQAMFGDGASSFLATSSNAFTNSAWHFCVARYTPSSSVAVFLDNTKTTFSTAIPAALVAGTSSLEIARLNSVNVQTLDGRIALPFLSAAALPDNYLTYLFNLTRGAFGI